MNWSGILTNPGNRSFYYDSFDWSGLNWFNLSGILANPGNYRLILAASAYNAHQGFAKFFSFFFSKKIPLW